VLNLASRQSRNDWRLCKTDERIAALRVRGIREPHYVKRMTNYKEPQLLRPFEQTLVPLIATRLLSTWLLAKSPEALGWRPNDDYVASS
jgi:hypothetical protein